MIKALIIFALIGCSACLGQTLTADNVVEQLVSCSWSDKHNACFCVAFEEWYSIASITWAPDKVCGK